jgi:hypothetical protein
VTVSQKSELVGFDADGAVRAARERVGDALRLAVEYTDESFRTLYADEFTMALYEDREAMQDHFESVHDYVGIDFAERDLFRDAFIAAGDVRALTTHMENAIFVRVLVADNGGLFFSLAPGTNVTSVVQAVEDAVTETEE